jgi:hypothetical protein
MTKFLVLTQNTIVPEMLKEKPSLMTQAENKKVTNHEKEK